jgi:hypothetical protein
MPALFYSTGQVARELGTTQAAIRVLCEKRLIAAETSPGGHWRIPASEVERLKRDGLPPIPRPLPSPTPSAANGTSNGHGYEEFVEEPSEEVALAADQVAITRSNFERRKIEREIEENEDWFRDRQRRDMVAAGPATFRPSEPDFSPERITFDTIVDGKPLRMFLSGMPMYRMEGR